MMRRLACLTLLIATPAAAQDFSMMANWAQGQMIQDNLRRNLGAGTRSNQPPVYATGPGIIQPRHPVPGSVAVPVGRGAPQRPVIAGASTAFHVSPAVTARVRQQIVAVTAEHAGPQAAQSYAAMLDRERPLDWWARKAASDGLATGDVADAMAEYWVQSWQLVNGVDLTNRAEMRAVRRQVQDELLANPRFARLGDAGKQELAELMIYSQASAGQDYFAARHRGDTASMQRITAGLVAGFQQQMHVDLHRLVLTDTGFHLAS